MVIFDIILLILLAGFVFYGFFFGLIRAVGALAGIIIGAWVASHYYLAVFGWIDQWWPGNPNIGKIVSFIVCFSIASRVVSWLVMLFEQAFNLAAVIPFLKTLNRLLGAVFGFIEGALAIGLVVYVASRYVPAGSALAHWLDQSRLVAFLIGFSKILAPMLPELYKKAKSFVSD